MAAKIIDGVRVSASIREECKARVTKLAVRGVTPGSAVILVGTNPASLVYVRNKIRACADVGIRSFLYLISNERQPGSSGEPGCA